MHAWEIHALLPSSRRILGYLCIFDQAVILATVSTTMSCMLCGTSAWGSSIFRYARHLKDYKPQLKTLGMQVIIGSLILDPVSCQTRLV